MVKLRFLLALVFSLVVTLPVYIFASLFCVLVGTLVLKPAEAVKFVWLMGKVICMDTAHFVYFGNRMIGDLNE